MVFVANKMEASENGGLQNPSDLDSPGYSNQQTLPVQLGNGLLANTGNPFASGITTGTKYSTTTFLFRQQYDLGQKDSIVTDTSVIPLFYPRVRLEHTFTYTTTTNQFMDDSTNTSYPGYGLNCCLLFQIRAGLCRAAADRGGGDSGYFSPDR